MEEKLLDEWKERLGLQDWVIHLCINCEHEDMDCQTAIGETVYNAVDRAAKIKILSKRAHGNLVLPYDFEKTLVHELLHCKFGFIDYYSDESEDGTKYTQTVLAGLIHSLIDDLARALVMAKRNETQRKLAEDCPKIFDMKRDEEKK